MIHLIFSILNQLLTTIYKYKSHILRWIRWPNFLVRPIMITLQMNIYLQIFCASLAYLFFFCSFWQPNRLPENSVVMVTESEREPPRNAARTRNMKPELPKIGTNPDSPLKHNGEEVMYSSFSVSLLHVCMTSYQCS